MREHVRIRSGWTVREAVRRGGLSSFGSRVCRVTLGESLNHDKISPDLWNWDSKRTPLLGSPGAETSMLTKKQPHEERGERLQREQRAQMSCAGSQREGLLLLKEGPCGWQILRTGRRDKRWDRTRRQAPDREDL